MVAQSGICSGLFTLSYLVCGYLSKASFYFIFIFTFTFAFAFAFPSGDFVLGDEILKIVAERGMYDWIRMGGNRSRRPDAGIVREMDGGIDGQRHGGEGGKGNDMDVDVDMDMDMESLWTECEDGGSEREALVLELDDEAESLGREHCSTHADAIDGNRTGGVQMTSRSQIVNLDSHLDPDSDSVSDDGDGDGDGDEENEEDALISNGAEQDMMNMEMEMEINLNKAQAWTLYLSHFLSTWNGRSYEFAAVSYVMRSESGRIYG